MSQQQEDGYYPRLNANMLQSGTYSQQIISLIGRIISNDGSMLTVQCADGGKAQVMIDPDFSARGPVVEIVGVVNENFSVQAFVTREMGDDFDLELYDQMLQKVYMNNRYKEFHRPDGAVM